MYALDLHRDDIYWCTADPGWVTGTSYGIIAPLLHGVTSIVDEARVRRRALVPHPAGRGGHGLVHRADRHPDADQGRRRKLPRDTDFPRLRFIASVGEPLNPEAVWWGKRVLGLPIHDNWWQTETGGIMIANYARVRHQARLDGPAAARASRRVIVHRNDDGTVDGRVDEPDVEGELALRPGWPSMFRGYLHDEERYRKCFADGWYLTGDLAQAGRGRILLVRRARGRRDQVRGPSDRSVRGGERADRPPGGRRGGRHRQARPNGRRNGQGIRHP